VTVHLRVAETNLTDSNRWIRATANGFLHNAPYSTVKTCVFPPAFSQTQGIVREFTRSSPDRLRVGLVDYRVGIGVMKSHVSVALWDEVG
jgi:hypothetical protein